jgi:twitching motility protein PilT
MVRPAEKAGEEEGEAIELASAAEMLHEYMHGPGHREPGTAAHAAATGIPTGSAPASPMGSQSGVRRGVAKDIQFRELPAQGRRTVAAASGRPGSARPSPPRARLPAPGAVRGPRRAMDQLLNFMLDRKASDLHLSSDTTPIIRVDGDMTPVEGYPPLSSGRSRTCSSPSPGEEPEQWLSIKDTDFAYETPRARFRVNVFEDRKGIGCVMRQIPNTIRTAQEMGLPQAVLDLCFLNKGLVVVTGSDRLGKEHHPGLDDRPHQPQPGRSHHHHRGPDRVRAPNRRCLVNQREIGVTPARSSTPSARPSARTRTSSWWARCATSRPSPSPSRPPRPVTWSSARSTPTPRPSTVDRIIDQFPADRQEQIRMMLSESLKGVITQTLCKKIGGGPGRGDGDPHRHLRASPTSSARGRPSRFPSMMQTGQGRRDADPQRRPARSGEEEAGRAQEAYAKAIHKTELKQMLERGGFKLEAEAA